MKRHAFILIKHAHGDKPTRALGTDGLIYLDGRKSLHNQVGDAKEYATGLYARTHGRPWGVRIYSGEFSRLSLLRNSRDFPIEAVEEEC